jgi:hypothetical protein
VLTAGGSLIVAFIDRASPLGQRYQRRKGKSRFYRDARFFSADEVALRMETTGFRDLTCVQTLFQATDQLTEPEPVRPGHGQGLFVVMRGIKAEDRPAQTRPA